MGSGQWLFGPNVKRFAAPSRRLAFTPDGMPLVSWSEDSTIRFWDTTTGAEIRLPSFTEAWASEDSVYRLVVTPDGKRVGAPEPGGVRFWNLETHKEMAFLRLSIEGIRVIASAPTVVGSRLAATNRKSWSSTQPQVNCSRN